MGKKLTDLKEFSVRNVDKGTVVATRAKMASSSPSPSCFCHATTKVPSVSALTAGYQFPSPVDGPMTNGGPTGVPVASIARPWMPASPQ